MPRAEVESYALAHHPTLGCEVKIKIRGNPQWLAPIKLAPADLAAVAAILNEQPVYLSNGWLHTGDEPVGGT
jgi:hypothetical protein